MKKPFMHFFILLLFLPVLFSTGCKTSGETELYDIRGTWDLIVWVSVGGNFEAAAWKITFVGSEISGTASDTYDNDNGTGTYTADNKQVRIIMNYTLKSVVCTYSGTFSDPDHITGTWQVDNDFGLFDLFR
jgi:hypothetical protein